MNDKAEDTHGINSLSYAGKDAMLASYAPQTQQKLNFYDHFFGWIVPVSILLFVIGAVAAVFLYFNAASNC